MITAVVEDTVQYPYWSVWWPREFETLPRVGDTITGTSSYLSGGHPARAKVKGIEHRQTHLFGSYTCIVVEQF